MSHAVKQMFLNDVIGILPECISQEVRQYIACQFAFESNFGQAPSAQCNNNYCGMKVAKFRITLACNLEECGQFAQFTGIYSCVMDYLLWLQSNRFSRQELNNLYSFKKHLDMAGYCPDLGYYDKIDALFTQYYG